MLSQLEEEHENVMRLLRHKHIQACTAEKLRSERIDLRKERASNMGLLAKKRYMLSSILMPKAFRHEEMIRLYKEKFSS